MGDILFEKKHGLGWVTLNRPKALNALSLAMIQSLHSQLNAWKIDDEVNAIVVQSNSDKSFCAGGDIRMLYDKGLACDDSQLDFFWHEYRLNHAISQYPKPYISLLNGITMGGGVGISLHGSHPVATENFNFAMPETGIGFFPDIGGGYLLSRCKGHIGNYLGLSGNRIDCHQAFDAGLLSHIIDSEYTAGFLDKLCVVNWSDDKHADIDGVLISLPSIAQASDLQTHFDAIEMCFNKESIEDIYIALTKFATPWAEKTLSILNKKSPTSLKLTLEQLKRAESMSLAECLIMEFRMVSHLMTQKDFYEGVRALIVDKDKALAWQPSTLEDVLPDSIEQYFAAQSRELNFSH